MNKLKIGDFLVCTEVEKSSRIKTSFTAGKAYKVIFVKGQTLLVEDDQGLASILAGKFVSMEEWREQKLNELGI